MTKQSVEVTEQEVEMIEATGWMEGAMNLNATKDAGTFYAYGFFF